MAAAAVASLALLAAIVRLPSEGQGGGAPPPAVSEQPLVTPIPALALSGRGRVSSTLPPVAAVTPTPTPPATVEPTPQATASAGAPAATSAPGASPGASGVPGGTGGSGGGSGGGGGTGTGTATLAPSATPVSGTPRPLPASPPPLEASLDRIQFLVLDISTRQPIGGVCVVAGTLDCGPNDYQTNASGQWWIDVAKNDTLFLFSFIKEGYSTRRSYKVEHVAGQNNSITIFLSRS